MQYSVGVAGYRHANGVEDAEKAPSCPMGQRVPQVAMTSVAARYGNTAVVPQQPLIRYCRAECLLVSTSLAEGGPSIAWLGIGGWAPSLRIAAVAPSWIRMGSANSRGTPSNECELHADLS